MDAEILADRQTILESVCELGVSAESTYTFEDGDAPELSVNVAAHVALTDASEAKSKADRERLFLRIDASFDLEYELSTAPPPEDRDRLFTAFASVNGAYNAWPYLREAVQSIITRMGLPPITLPVFRVADSSEKPKLRLVANKTR